MANFLLADSSYFLLALIAEGRGPMNRRMDVMRRCGRLAISPDHFAVEVTDNLVRSGNFREMQAKRIDQEVLSIRQYSGEVVGNRLVKIIGDRQMECSRQIHAEVPFGLSYVR